MGRSALLYSIITIIACSKCQGAQESVYFGILNGLLFQAYTLNQRVHRVHQLDILQHGLRQEDETDVTSRCP